MGSTRRSFSREFKLEAVRMVTESGHSLAQVARDLDIRPDMLRRWRRQFEQDPEQAFPGVGQRKAVDEEMWQLRRKLDRVTPERDREGWLYLAVLQDLCSRQIVGWATSSRLTRQLPQAALQMAIGRRRPTAAVLYHSDRGTQYASKDYRDALLDAGFEVSMSRRGDSTITLRSRASLRP